MKTLRPQLAGLLLVLCLGPSFAGAQTEQDLGRVYYQLIYKPGDWISFADTRFVSSIAVGFDRVYAGTSGGVVRIDLAKKNFYYPLTTSNGLLDNDVRIVAYERRTRFLWVASSTGLQFYDPLSELVTAATHAEMGLGNDERILSVGFHGSDVWIHTNRYDYVSHGTLFGFQKGNPPNEDMTWFGDLAIRDTPAIVVSTSSGYDYAPSETAFVDADFRKSRITTSAPDQYGDSWVGTYGAGVWFVHGVSHQAESLVQGLAMTDVSAMTFDDAVMWLGGNLGMSGSAATTGITHWDQTSDEFHYYPSGFRLGFVGDRTTALCSGIGSLWVGTEAGLARLDKKTDVWTMVRPNSGLFDEHVYALEVDTNVVYIGTAAGINYVKRVGTEYEIFRMEIPSLRNVAVYKIHCDGGTIWLGTGNGIFAIDRASGNSSHYNALGFSIGALRYTGEDVRGIADDDSNLYFASSGGVVRYDKSAQTWSSLPLNADFLNSGVTDAAADAQNLWIATPLGALRYVKPKKKWIYYGTKDGLAGEHVKCLLLDGDYVWFGTGGGLTQFFWNAPHSTD